MNNIINRNSKGQHHGYYERYYYNVLIYRGNYKNDERIGYEEWHSYKITRFNIK